MRSAQRPTVLAVVEEPGEEALPPIGTLTLAGWQGAHTALLVVRVGQDAAVRAATARAASLLGVESLFCWQAAAEPEAERLARVLRALTPTLLLTTEATGALAAEAWALASDAERAMPGLPPFAPGRARWWQSAGAAEATTRVEVSAAHPLLRALRFAYWGTPRESFGATLSDGGTPAAIEYFTQRAGPPVPETLPPFDLLAGLPLLD